MRILDVKLRFMMHGTGYTNDSQNTMIHKLVF